MQWSKYIDYNLVDLVVSSEIASLLPNSITIVLIGNTVCFSPYNP